MSVPTVDEDAWRTLEPGTAHPLQRLRAVRELVDAGINAGVLMAPIVPGFSSSRSKLERTIKAIADHGARFVGCNVMYLQDGTRTHFMKFIEREFPSMAPRFEKLYAKKYPPDAYRKEVQGMVRVLQARYGSTSASAQTPSRRRRRARSPNRWDSRGEAGCRLAATRRAGPCLRRCSRQATSPNAIDVVRRQPGGPARIRPRSRRRGLDHEVRAFLPARADRQLDLLVDRRASGSARRTPRL